MSWSQILWHSTNWTYLCIYSPLQMMLKVAAVCLCTMSWITVAFHWCIYELCVKNIRRTQSYTIKPPKASAHCAQDILSLCWDLKCISVVLWVNASLLHAWCFYQPLFINPIVDWGHWKPYFLTEKFYDCLRNDECTSVQWFTSIACMLQKS